MVLAVGTGRALIALPKANRPRGGGVSSAKAEGYPASRHGDFPLRREVMFIFRKPAFHLGTDSTCHLHLYPHVRAVDMGKRVFRRYCSDFCGEIEEPAVAGCSFIVLLCR